MAEGNKNKKYGRNAEFCKVYKNTGRLNKNRTRRLLRVLKKQPNNQQVIKVLDKTLNISATRIDQVVAAGLHLIAQKKQRKLLSCAKTRKQ